MFRETKLKAAISITIAMLLHPGIAAVRAAEPLEEIPVIGITPGAFAGQAVNRVPHAVFTLSSDVLGRVSMGAKKHQ